MRKAVLVSAALFGLVAMATALSHATESNERAPSGSGTEKPAGESLPGKPSESAAPTGGGETTAPRSATSSTPAPRGMTQTTSQPNKPVEHGPMVTKSRPHRQATHPSRPAAVHASNKGSQRCSHFALHSATSPADENASTDQYLRDAQTALRGRCFREANDALERAETRALNRPTETGKNSTVNTIEQAREALGHVRFLRPDLDRGRQLIDQAMSETGKTTSFLSGGGSGSKKDVNQNAGPHL